MIDPSLIHEIKGMDEVFKILPEGYSFHDAELVEAHLDMETEELTLVYSCYHGLKTAAGDKMYFVTFHLKPEMNDFEISISPHNPFTYGISISRIEYDMAKYRFETDGSGPSVNCQDMWVEIHEGDLEG